LAIAIKRFGMSDWAKRRQHDCAHLCLRREPY
jgi:hypothetical protein